MITTWLIFGTILIFTMHSHSLKNPSLIAKYISPASDMILEKVIVIHRHGDRAQISKKLGTKYPESSVITDKWSTKMPKKSSLLTMMLSAGPHPYVSVDRGQAINTQAHLYAGWDNVNYPYAQLTELGYTQMREVGKALRSRYCPELLSSSMKAGAPSLYCRSTSMCRTGQSLRSLLSGLFDVNPREEQNEIIQFSDIQDAPSIVIRPFEEENMYPHGGGDALRQRQNTIAPHQQAEKQFPHYRDLEKRVMQMFGLSRKVDWHTITEVLHCQHVHEIDHVEGISQSDRDRFSEIAAWQWGAIYKDELFNRIAIGRFIYDLLADLKSALSHRCPDHIAQSPITSTSDTERVATQGKTMLIYSGHDTTLVPVLSALGLYDDTWPPYASHLAVEVASKKSDPHSLFVRAVFNNQEMSMFQDSSTMWCPLEKFWRRLEASAVSPRQFEQACNQVTMVDQEGQEGQEGDEEDIDDSADAEMTAKEVEREVVETKAKRSTPSRTN